MNETIKILDELYQYIDRLESVYEDEGSLMNSETGRVFRIINEILYEAEVKHLLSKEMIQEYRDVLQDMKEHMGASYDDTKERFKKFKDIVNQHTDKCETSDRKLSEAFEIETKGDQAEDSEKSLQHISSLMRSYESSYLQNGALESLDMFYDVVNSIKEAVQNKDMSEATAKELLEPLKTIRDNVFDDEAQKEGIQKFNSILQSKLENSNGKGSATNTVGNIINGISSLRPKKEDQRNMQQSDVAKTQGEMNDILKKQKVESKENSNQNGNEAKDKALREQISKNQEQDSDKQLVEEFNYIRQNILKKYNRAKVYAGLSSMPRTAEGNARVAEVLEPMVNILNKIDVNKKYDSDRREHLEKFGQEWSRAMNELPGLHNYLQSIDADYDDIWNDMNQFEKFTNDFLQRAGIGQQSKEVLQKGKDFPVNPLEEKQDQRNMQQSDVAKTQGELNKVLEKQKVESKENSDQKGNEAQDKALREQISKNKEQPQSTEEKMTPEQAMAKINGLVNEYREIYSKKGSILDEDVFNVWKELTDTMNYAFEHKLVSKDVEQQLVDTHNFLRMNALNSSRQFEGIDRLQQIIGDKSDDKQIVRPQNEQDNVDMRKNPKLEQFKGAYEQNMSRTNDADGKQKALEDIQNFIFAYDNLFSTGQFGEATYELDKFSKYVSKAEREGMVSQRDAKVYKDLIRNIYMKKDQRSVSDAVEKMQQLHDKQFEGMGKSDDKQIVRPQNEQDNVDMRKNPKLEQFKGAYEQNMSRVQNETRKSEEQKPIDLREFIGNDMEKGKTPQMENLQQKEHKEPLKQEISPNDLQVILRNNTQRARMSQEKTEEPRTIDKQKNFRDGIQKVINNAEQKEEQKKLQERMLLKKIFGKQVE
jgi:hypothetical protein